MESKGNYSVPKEILELKPKGTMVKKVNNKYYVYELKAEKKNGKWVGKSGKYLGTLSKELGFVKKRESFKEGSTCIYDYGNYLLAYETSFDVLLKLKKYFNSEDAFKIYMIGLIYFVEGYQPLTKIDDYYKLSYISHLLPDLKFGYSALKTLVNNLARKTGQIEKFISSLLNETDELIVDGHSFESYSKENELSDFGYHYKDTGNKQIDMLMIYNKDNYSPVYVEVFNGSIHDKSKLKELFASFSIKNKLFIFDRGFYSSDNISLIVNSGSTYVTPLSANLSEFKEVTKTMNLTDSFVYTNGKKKTTIEYKKINKTAKKFIYVFRDTLRNAELKSEFLIRVNDKNDEYNINDYNYDKERLGTIVLETNLELDPSNIYDLYAKRWSIETYFDYVKNSLSFDKLNFQDYYTEKGVAYLLLIEGLIYGEVRKNIKNVNNNSIKENLFFTKAMKLKYDPDKKSTRAVNVTTKISSLFEDVGIKILDTPSLHIPKN